MKHDRPILFLSHTKSRCGVHQFGLHIAAALKASAKYDFRYVECGDATDFLAACEGHSPAAIVYNYHEMTMPWLDRRLITRYRVPHVGFFHEITQERADTATDELFDYRIGADPTLLLRNPLVYKTGRLVPRYTNSHTPPSVPTIGSFGFGTDGKGFEALVARVQAEFDRAVIRLHIPYASFGDSDGQRARGIAARCRRLLTKPDIRMEISHDFLATDQLLAFLAGNSLNAFFYEQHQNRGIASVIDLALAVQRPLAITRSAMFRHVRDTRPPITVEDASLAEILGRGFWPLVGYTQEWTPENMAWDFERIIDSVLRSARTQAPPPSAFRTALTTVRTMLRKRRERRRKRRSPRAQAKGSVRPTHFSPAGDWVPTTIDMAARSPLASVEPYKPMASVGGLNRILDKSASELYFPALDYMFRHVPELMARKIPEANVQQAFVLDTVVRAIAGIARPSLLCVGSFEDTAAEAMAVGGYPVVEIDPVINYDLATYMTKPSCRRGAYHVVFATSVLEHVSDDEQFVRNIEELLAPGGIGVLTCDFKDDYRVGDPKPSPDFRLYTTRDFHQRLLPAISRCDLIDSPDWRCAEPDFVYDGCRYTFASFVFRRVR